MLNVVEAARAEFTGLDATNYGRFSGSIAQDGDLEPTEAMLRRHTLRCSVLPAIYAGKQKVASNFDLLVRAHRCTRSGCLCGHGRGRNARSRGGVLGEHHRLVGFTDSQRPHGRREHFSPVWISNYVIHKTL